MANKVKFGLKKVYYSVITDATTRTYATPVAIPGAVTLETDPKGEKTEFYADDIAYFVAEANQGYEGSIEFALLPDSFYKDVLGWKEDANGALFEDSAVLPKKIGLLFEISGDQHSHRHVMYDVTVSRPGVSSATKTATLEPQPETLEFVAGPNPFTGYVKAKIGPGTGETPQAAYTDFFTSVYSFAAPAEPPQG